MLELVRQWLKAGYMEEGEVHETTVGSPQGVNAKPALPNLWQINENVKSVWRKGGRVGNILRSFPSRKAIQKMRAKVKEETSPRNRLYWSPEQLIDTLNPRIQGWRNYYATVDPGMSRRFLSKVDGYIARRLILYWRKKHKRSRLTPTQIMGIFRSKGLKPASGYGGK